MPPSPSTTVARYVPHATYALVGGACLVATILFGNPDDRKLEPMCARFGLHWVHHGEWFRHAGDAASPVLECAGGAGGPQEFLVKALPR